MRVRISFVLWAALLLGGALYLLAVQRLATQARVPVSVEMATALPRFVQVVMSGGDRFLAANLAVFRAVVASTETLKADNFRIQGIVQRDAAWLNPAHEDNFYVAAAILSWNGQLDAANQVLDAAVLARKKDPFPAFYLAFNRYYFEKRTADAGRLMLLAAERAETIQQQQAFQFLAGKWFGKDRDIDAALDVLRVLQASAAGGRLKQALAKRIVRLEAIKALTDASEVFARQYGRRPSDLGELRRSGVINKWPVDPLGGTFQLDPDGRINVIEKRKAGK